VDLQIRIDWRARAEAARRLPPCAGVWFAAGPFRVAYPRSRSSILAVGVSPDLRATVRQLDRARSPAKAAAVGVDNDLLAAVLANEPAAMRWSVLALPTLSEGAVEAVAAAVLDLLVQRLGVLPYGCGRVPVAASESVWEGTVGLAEPAPDARTPALDALGLARRYGLECVDADASPAAMAITLGESTEAAGDVELARRDSGRCWPCVRFVRPAGARVPG